MKKILLLLLIVLIWYVISIFLAPKFSDNLADIFWIKSFNENLRENWWDFNRIFTNIPSSEELEKWYDDALDKAKELKNDAADWVQIIKDNIDDIRTTLSWAEDKIERAKEVYNNTIETVDKLKETYKDVEKMWEAIHNVVNTWALN